MSQTIKKERPVITGKVIKVNEKSKMAFVERIMSVYRAKDAKFNRKHSARTVFKVRYKSVVNVGEKVKFIQVRPISKTIHHHMV